MRGGGGVLSELLINVNIPEKYLHIYPGESVLAETEIILIQTENAATIHDILIEYTIKNYNDAVVTKILETKGGSSRINTIEELNLPSDAQPGIYTLEVTVSKENILRKDSETFEVMEKIPESKNGGKIRDYVTLILIILNLTLILAVFFLARRHKCG